MFNQFNRFEDAQNSVNKNLEVENVGLQSGQSKNRLRNFFYILPLIFLILTLVFSLYLCSNSKAQGKQSLKEATATVKYLADNLKTAPIDEVKVVRGGEACPIDYHSVQLGEFEGIKAGCLCEDGNVFAKAHCTTKNADKCKYQAEINSKKIYVFQGQTVCAKRVKTYQHVLIGETCKTDYKQCQKNLCVPNHQKCPVSGLQIVARVPDTTQGDIAFGASHVLVISRDTKEEYLTELAAQISNYPCSAHGLRNPETKSKNFYPLSKIQHDGCGKYRTIEPFSDKISSDSTVKFYKDNGLEDVTKAAFADKYFTDKDIVNLYEVNVAPVKNTKECQSVNADDLPKYDKDNKEIQEGLQILAIITSVLSAIGLILIVLFFVFRHQIKFFNTRAALYLIYVICFIVVILCIVTFGIFQGIKDENDFDKTESQFKSLAKNNCFSKLGGIRAANNDINDYSHSLNHHVGKFVIALFITGLIFFFLALIGMAVRKAKKMNPLPDPAV